MTRAELLARIEAPTREEATAILETQGIEALRLALADMKRRYPTTSWMEKDVYADVIRVAEIRN